jgi:hypothetical protein
MWDLYKHIGTDGDEMHNFLKEKIFWAQLDTTEQENRIIKMEVVFWLTELDAPICI